MILTGKSSLEPPWPCTDVIPLKGGPTPLSMGDPGHLVEDHPDRLTIKRLPKLLLLLQSLLVQLGEPSNKGLARRRPRNLPRRPPNLRLDLLSLRGPSGNVSVLGLSTPFSLLILFSVADTRYVPTPPTTEPQLLVPPRGSPGLFGPRSPRDSLQQ